MNLNCASPIEIPYYNTNYEPLCYYYGSLDVLNEDSEEFHERYPVCQQCLSDKKPVLARRKHSAASSASTTCFIFFPFIVSINMQCHLPLLYFLIYIHQYTIIAKYKIIWSQLVISTDHILKCMERIVTQKICLLFFNAIFGCCICWSYCPAFPGTKIEFPCLKKWFPRDLSSV